MPDIRIKDLTTTASTTAADDFFAADGSTNGTRKLSAYSPSFGGNATVGGTLTVNGATMSVGGGSGSIVSALDGTAGNYKLHLFRSGGVDRWYCGVQAATESGSNAGAPFGITALSDAGAQIDIPLQITRAAGGSIFLGRPVKAQDTTASTSTSSGALVVGNGTSGGLGVGGALYVGSAGTFGGTVRVSTGNGTAATFSLLQAGQQQWAVEIPASTTNLRLRAVDAGVDALTLGSNGSGTFAGAVGISSTTASTSTSSGALVVSGGVGVAGAINGGGLFDFAVSANSTQVYTIQNTSTGASASTRLTLVGGTSSGSIQLYGSGHSTPNILQYASPDTHKWQCNGVERASLSSAGALTVGSSLTTGAPSGGTSAAWKLGAVATVSPTSPNRTIEVDIGGTIYYIHAKTTNN
jgi:hypothetical protein